MKKNKLIFFLVFCSCMDNNTIKKPDNLIGEKKMEAILYDIAIVNSVRSSSFQNLNYSDLSLNSYIFKKHQVDSIQLVKSEIYYSKLPRIYLRIHKNVEKRLKKVKDSLGNLLK